MLRRLGDAAIQGQVTMEELPRSMKDLYRDTEDSPHPFCGNIKGPTLTQNEPKN